MAENKTKATQVNVNDFINAITDQQKREDSKKLVEMMQEITGEKPVMWGPSMVGFGEYHYKYESGREGDMFCVGFSPRKQALTVYMMTGYEGFQEYMQKLGKYKTGQSCLYVKKLADIDEKVLRDMISISYRKQKSK